GEFSSTIPRSLSSSQQIQGWQRRDRRCGSERTGTYHGGNPLSPLTRVPVAEAAHGQNNRRLGPAGCPVRRPVGLLQRAGPDRGRHSPARGDGQPVLLLVWLWTAAFRQTAVGARYTRRYRSPP